MVEAVTTTRFQAEVLESDVPVVVDFWADWCAPCKVLAPKVEALAAEWKDQIRFVKVDTQAEPKLARAYNISSIPSLLLFQEGEVTGWSIGVKPAYMIEKELRLKKVARKPGRERKEHGSVLKWMTGVFRSADRQDQ